jgi:DNA-binding transcriptional ArsR family regulator
VAYRYAASSALAALADPTRRAIFERLVARPLAVGLLARDLPISRPAVSQHLRALKEAGLVTEAAAGTRRIYRIDPRGIAAMREWLQELWSAALDSFKDFAGSQAEKDASP